VFRERHVVGGIESIGSVVGESARVGPCGVVQMLLSCSTFRPSSVSAPSIGNMMLLCCGRWYVPCVCGCGSKAFCLHVWVCVWGFLRVVMVLELPKVYYMSLSERCCETL